MTDYFRGKTLICEQTKPRTYFTPVFQRIGDRLELHHMEVDCLSFQHSKKMLPIEHMGKHKRRIFELEDENAKLRELIGMIGNVCDGTSEVCEYCKNYSTTNDECTMLQQMHELGIKVEE